MRDFGYSEKGQSVTVADLALWRRILRYSADYRLPIGVAVILSLGVTGATLGLPYLLKTAIDGYITADQLAMEQRLAGITTIGLWFAALIAVNFLLMFTQVVLLEWVGQSVMHRIRQELFAHIVNLDLSFLTRQPVGRLVTRLTNDVQNMHEMFTSVLVTLFNDILRIFGILIVLLVLNSKLGGIMSLYVPLAFVMTWVFSQMAREKFRAIRAQLSRINTYIQESVSGIAIIQLFNAQSRFARDFLNLSDEYLRRTLSQIRLFAAFMPLSELLSTTAIAIILWFGGSLILKNQLTIGELVCLSCLYAAVFSAAAGVVAKILHRPVGAGLSRAHLCHARCETAYRRSTPPATPKRNRRADRICRSALFLRRHNPYSRLRVAHR
jgi:ATP-binding cassette subfamily B multidrug efflux pump